MKAANVFSTCAKSLGLVPYEVDGRSLFPLYGGNGYLTTVTVGFVAKDAMDFPEGSPFKNSQGLSDDGKYFRLDFDGRREYGLQEMHELLVCTKEALA